MCECVYVSHGRCLFLEIFLEKRGLVQLYKSFAWFFPRRLIVIIVEAKVDLIAKDFCFSRFFSKKRRAFFLKATKNRKIPTYRLFSSSCSSSSARKFPEMANCEGIFACFSFHIVISPFTSRLCTFLLLLLFSDLTQIPIVPKRASTSPYLFYSLTIPPWLVHRTEQNRQTDKPPKKKVLHMAKLLPSSSST